jgi:hypothetical protein
MNILNFLFSNPLSWGFASALFFILGYSWTTKVDDVDDVMASHINLLQTEKLDRDGAIPMTGNLTTPGIIPTGLATGYIPYKPAGVLANSPISTDGTNVGIGTPSPGEKLTLRSAYGQLGFEDSDVNKHWTIGSSQDTGLAILEDDTTERVFIQAGGNVGIGITAFGASAAKVLTLGDGTAPGALVNTASIVSLSGELYGVDAAGNQTLNSPHKNEILDNSDPIIPYPWCYYAKNPYLGKEVLLDWSAVVAEVERLSGKKFVIYRDILSEEKRDWVADQFENISAERERRIREKMNEEVEIETAEAFEDLPITMKVDSGKEEFRYASEDGKIIKKATPIMIDQPTGETKKRLKNGIRLDEKTGKIYRKKTREEVENLIEEPIAQQLPKWMADRGVKNG